MDVGSFVADVLLVMLLPPPAKAKTYQETMSMSKSAIYDQLISEYGEQFTAEQAQYAVDHLE